MLKHQDDISSPRIDKTAQFDGVAAPKIIRVCGQRSNYGKMTYRWYRPHYTLKHLRNEFAGATPSLIALFAVPVKTTTVCE